MIRATKETEAGRRYLDLQRKAKQTGRPTDELIQLYALEGFLSAAYHLGPHCSHSHASAPVLPDAPCVLQEPTYPIEAGAEDRP